MRSVVCSRLQPSDGPDVGGDVPGDLSTVAFERFRRQVLRPRTLISTLILLVVLGLFARRVLDLNLDDLWLRLRAANPGLLVLDLLVFYLSVVVRTLRWQTLLANVGYRRSADAVFPATVGLGKIVLLASLANSLTIGQLGDALRGYLLKRQAPRVSFTIVLGTVVAERLLDVVILLALMSGSALVAFHGELPVVATDALDAGLIVAALGTAALLSIYRLGAHLAWLLPTALQPCYHGLERGLLDSFRQSPLLLAYTIGGWLIEGATLYLAAAASGVFLSVAGALVVATLASLLGVVSVTPGGVGVTEAGIVLLLRPLGVDPVAAGTIAILNRLINYWSVMLVGLIVYAVTGPC